MNLDQPVGSKWIAEQDDVPWGPSTVRAELARLEEFGLLEHPHTSAGRVPTDRGYRYYVDELLTEGRLPVPRKPLELTAMRRQVDEAMRATTEQLSQVTNLLALVTAPPIETATIHRVEVLLLQPQVAMVVVITSTGGVTKRVISYDEPVDPGLVDWAASYLNEALGGMDVGSRMIGSQAVGAGARASRARLPGHAHTRFHRARADRGSNLFMEGAARLLTEHRFQELSQIAGLMEVLEHRRALLGVLRASLTEPSVYLRIGAGEPDAGAADRVDRRRQLRAGAAQPRRGVGDRPGADGLPARDRRRARGGA